MFARREQKPIKDFTDDARQFLQQYPWPGNVRQLEDLIHSLVVLSDHQSLDEAMLQAALEGDIRGSQNPFTAQASAVSESPSPSDLGMVRPLWQVEKSSIEEAIAFCGGNVPRAAALLEVSPSTIYRKQKHW